MSDILIMIASNLFVAGIIAIIALLIERTGRHRSIVHALWIVVLVKLITPPIVELPLIPVERSVVNASPTDDELNTHFDEHSEISSPDLYEPELITARELDDWSLDQEYVVEIDVHKAPVPPPIQRFDSSTNKPAPSQPNKPASTSSLLQVISVRAIFYVIVCVWLAGGSIWLLRVFRDGQQMRRALRLAREHDSDLTKQVDRQVRSVADRIGLSRPPQAIVAACNIVPMIWATCGRPTLVLPRKLVEGMSSHQVESLIAHELAHLKCGHHWVRRFEIVVMTLYWWCPLVWLARRKLRESEEEICDAWVTHVMPENTRDYANALVDTLAFLDSKKQSMPAAAMGISQFQLLNRRITMIMQNDTRPGLSFAGWLVLIAVLMLGIPFSPSKAVSEVPSDPAANLHNTVSSLDEEDEDDEHDGDRDDEPDHDDDWDEDEDEHEEDGDDEEGNWDEEEIEENIEEMIEELTEELQEMDEEIEEEIEEIREDLIEGFEDSPRDIQLAISRMNIEEIVRDSLRKAPKSARMLVNEVDPVGIVAELRKRLDFDEDELDDEAFTDIQEHIEDKLSYAIEELVGRVNRQIQEARNEVKNGIGELPEFAREELIRRNLIGVIDEIAEDASPIARQFMKDANIRNHIRKALRQRGGDDDRAERESRDRDDAIRSLDRMLERERRADRGDADDEERDIRRQRRRRIERDRREDPGDIDEQRRELENQIEQLMDQLNALKQELRELNRRDKSGRSRER